VNECAEQTRFAVHGGNSYHPMALNQSCPFDTFTRACVVLAALCIVGMMVAGFWR